MTKINLDALIPREDFEVKDNNKVNITRTTDTLRHEDLKHDAFFFAAIRKPDFQRETNEWDEYKIIGLLESYLDGDLIPAVILWKNPSNYTFVIDGAHRLSAIAAWMNDDYGDGEISKKFFDSVIPEDQIESAERIRQQIRKRIGSFKDFKLAITNPDKVSQTIIERIKNLATLALQVQWVDGDSAKAEASFFKINQHAARINDTEMKLLKSRKNANCIAARAIIRAGTGHKYWAKFEEQKQESIERLSKEINDILFIPNLKNPIKTLDLPLAGKLLSAGSLQLILNLVNISNNIDKDSETTINKDVDGDETLKNLHNCLKICRKINSNHPSSLGLHPIVYFYSKDGRHKPASFYGVIGLLIDFENKPNLLKDFIKVRGEFEDIILKYDYLVQQIGRKYRQADKAVIHIKSFYLKIIELLKQDKEIETVIDEIIKSEKFNYLTKETFEDNEYGTDFSRGTKSKTFIKEAITNALKCKICGGYIHKNSISIDHIQRKEDGGTGSPDNAQLTHPYCNTSYKN
ncbi:MAG: HNH endonuclease [Spirochaetes bacterium]|nr:HNH endonuclease [Spirochaetota bacterium]